MRIIGIGNDLIEIERFEKYRDNRHFLEKCFTETEIEQAGGRMARLAADFSVKESVAKVFGTGIVGFSLTDIEVLRDEAGKPYVKLYNQANVIARKLGIRKMHVSISDTAALVMTMAVGEGG